MAEEKKNRVKTAMGGKKKKSSNKKSKAKRPVKGMHIRRAAEGKFIARHEYDGPQDQNAAGEPDEHALESIQALQAHVGDHFQEQEQPQMPTGGAGGA